MIDKKFIRKTLGFPENNIPGLGISSKFLRRSKNEDLIVKRNKDKRK